MPPGSADEGQGDGQEQAAVSRTVDNLSFHNRKGTFRHLIAHD